MTLPRLTAYAMAAIAAVLVGAGGWLLAPDADGGQVVYFASACLLATVRGVPLAVTLDICTEPVPEDLATTAYYVASEALANTVKHAAATAVHLRVSRTGSRLTVTIRDDGVGGACVRPGGGLAGITDRVAAAGGALTVAGRPGDGTLIEAVLPCGL